MQKYSATIGRILLQIKVTHIECFARYRLTLKSILHCSETARDLSMTVYIKQNKSKSIAARHNSVKIKVRRLCSEVKFGAIIFVLHRASSYQMLPLYELSSKYWAAVTATAVAAAAVRSISHICHILIIFLPIRYAIHATHMHSIFTIFSLIASYVSSFYLFSYTKYTHIHIHIHIFYFYCSYSIIF